VRGPWGRSANLDDHQGVAVGIAEPETSNLKRAGEPGNVLLDDGEGNLPKQSVVVVSQVSSIQKTDLGVYLGALSDRRVEQILAGMRFQQASYFASGRRA
jgi:mRNA-degrading endonuclease toxin of MazEF toxin-antitoxin module